MREKEMVSQYTDEFGFPRYFGDVNYEEGGIVNGYAGGGLIKKGLEKILASSAFNISRRKFLKQSGAATAMAAMPGSLAKGLIKAATPTAVSASALRNAPPWMKYLYASLKHSQEINRKVSKDLKGS